MRFLAILIVLALAACGEAPPAGEPPARTVATDVRDRVAALWTQAHTMPAPQPPPVAEPPVPDVRPPPAKLDPPKPTVKKKRKPAKRASCRRDRCPR